METRRPLDVTESETGELPTNAGTSTSRRARRVPGAMENKPGWEPAWAKRIVLPSTAQAIGPAFIPRNVQRAYPTGVETVR
jgi:hypothetical protein